MAGRLRKTLYGGVSAGLAAGGLFLAVHFTSMTAENSLSVQLEGKCYNLLADSGIKASPSDAQSDVSGGLWNITIDGIASIGPLHVTIFDGDFANQIDAFTTEKGSWSRTLNFTLGWHKLIFRVVYNGSSGKNWETVRWIGLATSPPVWDSPGYYSVYDAGCSVDAGCPSFGFIPRCGILPYKCFDAGCADAKNQWGPIGCVRGCGTASSLPDAGCNDLGSACPGYFRPEAGGQYYKPNCCHQLVNANGLHYSQSIGWCSGGETSDGNYVGIGQGEALLHINFGGIRDDGCGTDHILIPVLRTHTEWPPGDGGYTYDFYRSTVKRKWDYYCRPKRLGRSTATVPYVFEAGVRGIPYCQGNWCCVVAKIYPDDMGGI